MCLVEKLEETDIFFKEKVQGDIKTVFQLIKYCQAKDNEKEFSTLPGVSKYGKKMLLIFSAEINNWCVGENSTVT